jgi:two-component system OmpR family response regulator
MIKILFAEDDQKLADLVVDFLSAEGYELDHVTSGPVALKRLEQEQYDGLILDVGLPGMSGFDVCQAYRKHGGSAPILFLTGQDTLADKERGLDLGADDYLTKPFHMRELGARLRAIARRSRTNIAVRLEIGDLSLDAANHTVSKAGIPLQLMPQEYALLNFFMRNPRRTFSQNELLDQVWSKESDASPDTVRVHITKLRAKIDTPGAESIIKTVHRVGYKLEP